MSKRNGIRVGSLIAALSICLLIAAPTSAQYTAEDKQVAIDAVTAYLKDMGETKAAKTWVENWANGTYSFGVFDADGEVDAGTPNIAFNEQMLVQLHNRGRTGTPDRKLAGDWAATFMHELVHTRQWGIVYSVSEAAHRLGRAHPAEAEAWGEGFKYYWKWMRISNARYAKARTYEEKQKYAKEIIDLANSFKIYDSNYRQGKLGPLPKGLRFESLDGREGSDPLKFAEALREADKIIKKLTPTLHLAVRLSPVRYRVKPGDSMRFEARPENVWSPNSKDGDVRFTWRAGSKQLAETSSTLIRTATVDETITVIAQDDRSQKASASCQVIVEKPAVAVKPAPQTPAPETAAKPPAPVPAPKTPAPTQADAKATPIKLDLDAKPTQVTRAGSFIVKTWGGTTMDTFRIGGGELTSASFSRSQGRIIYNVKGTFKPGQNVSLAVTGSQWDMSKSMVGLKHNRAKASIRYLDRSGKLIGETIEHDTGESKSPSLSASVSGSVPADAATAIMEGQFDCTWASAFTTSETAGVKVTLTVEK